MCRLMFLVLISMLSAPFACAASDLHLLIVCDQDDPDLGEGFRINRNLLVHLLVNNVASRNLKITDLYRQIDRQQRDANHQRNQQVFNQTGEFPPPQPVQLTADNVVNKIRALPVDNDDTLIVYIACHGYFHPSVGNYFGFAGAEHGVARQSLIDEIKARRPRLGGIISDSCQEYSRMQLPVSAQSPPGDELLVTSPLCQSLFFEQEGFLDWSAAKEGEFAVYYNNYRTLLNVDRKTLEKNWARDERSGPPAPPGAPRPYSFGWEFLSIIQRGPGGERIRSVQAKGGIFTEALTAIAHQRMQEKLDWNQFHQLVQQKTAQDYAQEVPTGKIDVGGFQREQPTQTVVLTTAPTRISGGQPTPKPPMPRPRPKPPIPTPPKPPIPSPPKPMPPNPRPQDSGSSATGTVPVLFTNSSAQSHIIRLVDNSGNEISQQNLPPQSAWATFVADRQRWTDVVVGSANQTMGRIGVGQPTVTLGSGVTGVNSYGALCYERADGNGVVVVQVIGNSQADRDGLKDRDIITMVNGTPVNDVASYNAAIARSGGRVGVMVERGRAIGRTDGTFEVTSSAQNLGMKMAGGDPNPDKPPVPKPPVPNPPIKPTPTAPPVGDMQLTVVNTGNVQATVRITDSSGTVIHEQKVAAQQSAIVYGKRGQKWDVTAVGTPPHAASFQVPRYYHRVGPQPAVNNRLGAWVTPEAGSKRVVIGYVGDGSTAYDYQFTPGDVVVSINGQDITDVASYEKAVSSSGLFMRIVLERPQVVTTADGKQKAVGVLIESTIQLSN